MHDSAVGDVNDDRDRTGGSRAHHDVRPGTIRAGSSAWSRNVHGRPVSSIVFRSTTSQRRQSSPRCASSLSRFHGRGWALVVSCKAEPLEPAVEIACEGKRDVGSAERGHNLEARTRQRRSSVDPEHRKAPELVRRKVVDLGVIAGIEGGEAPPVPSGVAPTEQSCLRPRVLRNQVVSTDHDLRVGRNGSRLIRGS